MPENDHSDSHKPRWQEVQSIQAKIKSLSNNIDKVDEHVQGSLQWWEQCKQQRDSLLERRQELYVKLESMESAADRDSESQLRQLSNWTKNFVEFVQRKGGSVLEGSQELNELFGSMPDAIAKGVEGDDAHDQQMEYEVRPAAPVISVPWIKRVRSTEDNDEKQHEEGSEAPLRQRRRAGSAERQRRSASRSPPPGSRCGEIGNGRGRRQRHSHSPSLHR